MKPIIGISDYNLQEVALFLNTLLADEYVAYTKTRSAYWNMTGINFGELHRAFQIQSDNVDKIIDSVAERIRSLGHFALGSMKDFLAITNLSEENPEARNTGKVIQDILNDHETIIRILRNKVGELTDKYRDAGTADFITELMEQHEKMAWELRSSLM
jgi:starvation-inducible DNA-binding protein